MTPALTMPSNVFAGHTEDGEDDTRSARVIELSPSSPSYKQVPNGHPFELRKLRSLITFAHVAAKMTDPASRRRLHAIRPNRTPITRGQP